MTDLKDQFARLLDHEPEAPYDIDRIVHSGRRARSRHNAAVAAAGTIGVIGVTAAVVVPLMVTGGTGTSVSVGVQPSPSPSPTAGTTHCYLISASPRNAKLALARLIRSGQVGTNPSVKTIRVRKGSNHQEMEVCAQGSSTAGSAADTKPAVQTPAGPAYTYTEEPAAISSRLGAHLHTRVTDFGLAVSYTRPFAQESSTLEHGQPSYFGGNVDVHETSGYADIGVQVTHEATALVPFTDECSADQHCVQTTLPDGSVLRTGQVDAGSGDTILTAEVHRTDGVVVQAQESDYPFGPNAGSQRHGDMPLTLQQLVAFAEDEAFTF